MEKLYTVLWKLVISVLIVLLVGAIGVTYSLGGYSTLLGVLAVLIIMFLWREV